MDNNMKDDEFTMIRVKALTRDRLKALCPQGLQFQYFTTEFIEGALDDRELLIEQHAGK